MDLSDASRFVGRDWRTVADLKESHWVDRLRRLGPLESLRVTDELRLHVLSVRPGGSSPEERGEDLASHDRVSRLLRQVARVPGR